MRRARLCNGDDQAATAQIRRRNFTAQISPPPETPETLKQPWVSVVK